MYENLIALMAVRKVSKKTIADRMGINRAALYNKLNGKSKFSLSEMFFIHQNFFSDIDKDYLFAKTDKTA